MNTPSHDKLERELEKLPRSIEPARDLWPGIATRTAPRDTWSRHSWSYGVAVAAVVVAAASLTWGIFKMPKPKTNQTMVTNTVPGNPSVPTKAVDLLAQFTAKLVSDTNLPSKARLALLDNLRMVHANILRTQAAVKKYPDDVNLRALLFNLYQQEAQLMNQAQQVQIQTTVRSEI